MAFKLVFLDGNCFFSPMALSTECAQSVLTCLQKHCLHVALMVWQLEVEHLVLLSDDLADGLLFGTHASKNIVHMLLVLVATVAWLFVEHKLAKTLSTCGALVLGKRMTYCRCHVGVSRI